ERLGQTTRRFAGCRRQMLPARVQLLGGSNRFSPDLPMAVQVEFTSRCNLRCRMCPLTTKTSSTSATPGPMFDAVFDEVLAIARRCRRVIVRRRRGAAPACGVGGASGQRQDRCDAVPDPPVRAEGVG